MEGPERDIDPNERLQDGGYGAFRRVNEKRRIRARGKRGMGARGKGLMEAS